MHFGQFDTSGESLFVAGTGVNETPNNGQGTPLAPGAVLGATSGGEIDLSISGTSATLWMNGGGQVVFTTHDFAIITWWIHDAPAGQVQEVFSWSASAGTYVFTGYL